MKRLLSILILILPILACSGLTKPISATNAPPLFPPTTVSTTQTVPPASTEAQAVTEIPTTFSAPENTTQFPNPENYEWRQILSGLQRPVDLQSPNDGTGRLFIIEKYGAIRVYENGQLLDEPFLNIDARVDDSGNEMGLLGLAFSPNYAQDGYFYVNYTGDRGHTRISRFHAAGNHADPNSEVVLLLVEQPYENHNGGSLTFGPDGYLYIGLGDGGSGGDPEKNGQNTGVLLGKILRIDVSGNPYSIPADNPFGNEIWAYGLRNPWRIAFDRATGDLWIGDVGQGEREEIDYLPAGSAGGANFGWNIMEGSLGFEGEAQPGLLLPVAEYSHSDPYEGCSVTGGYVYRGAMPEWNSVYLYGDYCTGYIWGLLNVNGQFQNQKLFEIGNTITSFGQGSNGEIYFLSDTGEVYELTQK